jgi:hypothetical protein
VQAQKDYNEYINRNNMSVGSFKSSSQMSQEDQRVVIPPQGFVLPQANLPLDQFQS